MHRPASPFARPASARLPYQLALARRNHWGRADRGCDRRRLVLRSMNGVEAWRSASLDARVPPYRFLMSLTAPREGADVLLFGFSFFGLRVSLFDFC
jgi:hypothetical protein